MKKIICKIFGHRWKEFIYGDGTLRHYEIGGKKCVRCGKIVKVKEMKKYRKKPVVIEAVQLTFENQGEVKEWCGGKTYSTPPMRAVTGIEIKTLEGNMAGLFGDWIIKGVKGEFYPCKPDVFEQSYEPAQ